MGVSATVLLHMQTGRAGRFRENQLWLAAAAAAADDIESVASESVAVALCDASSCPV